MEKFTIDITNHRESMLYRPSDGKMCCIGQYLCAVSLLDVTDIESQYSPEDVNSIDIPEWLLDHEFNSPHAKLLMAVNDAAWYNPAVQSRGTILWYA